MMKEGSSWRGEGTLQTWTQNKQLADFFFSIHLSVLERVTRTFWLLRFFSHRLAGSRFAPSARVSHQKTWELVTYTCKPRNALLICIWRQINFRKIEWVSFAFLQHVLLLSIKPEMLYRSINVPNTTSILLFSTQELDVRNLILDVKVVNILKCLQQPTYTP